MAKTDATETALKDRLEFKELMEILSQDTMNLGEFARSLKGEENCRMSATESQEVISFLLEQDPDKAQEKFDKIYENLIKIPSTVEGWAEVREEALKDIETIKQRQLACQEQKEKWLAQVNLMKNATTLQKEDGTPMVPDDVKADFEKTIDALQKQLDENDKKMNMLTAQISALTLMDAHAKTHEQQLESKTRTEEMAPTRKSLSEWWQERYGQYKTMNQNIKQARQLSDFSRVEKKAHRELLKDARNHAKQSNKLQAKIDKQEQEIIKRAQKVAMKDFRKNRGVLGLKALARGERIAPPNIETIEKANAYMLTSDRAQNDDRLQSMMKNLESLQNAQATHDTAIASALGQLNDKFVARRQEIIELAQQVDQQLDNGEIGSLRVGAVNKYLNKGLEEAAIDLDDVYFTDELKDFMHKNGFDHMLKGHQFDGPAIGNQDMDDQEIEIGDR